MQKQNTTPITAEQEVLAALGLAVILTTVFAILAASVSLLVVAWA